MSRISVVYVICLVLVSSGMALQFGQSTPPEEQLEKVARRRERKNDVTLKPEDVAEIEQIAATLTWDDEDIEGSAKGELAAEISAKDTPEDSLVRDAPIETAGKKISTDPGPEARDLAIASGLAAGLAVRAVAAGSSPFNSTTVPTTAAVALPSGIFAAMMDKYHTHFPIKYVTLPGKKWSNVWAAHLVRAGYAAAVGAGIGAAVQSIPGLDTDDLVYPAVGASSALMSYGIGQWRDTDFNKWLEKRKQGQQVKDAALLSTMISKSGISKGALLSGISSGISKSGISKAGNGISKAGNGISKALGRKQVHL